MQRIVFGKQAKGLADVVESRQYVCLETTDECLLSETTRVVCASVGIYVMDVRTQAVYITKGVTRIS